MTKAKSGDHAGPHGTDRAASRGGEGGRSSKKQPKPPEVPETPGVARIIAIANQKGGVGKSTTAVSLAASLAELGYRVLVVDLDPQGNASTGLGIRHEARETTVYDVLVAEAPVLDAVVHTMVEGLHAVPSTIDLAGAEIELVSQFSRETRLKRALAQVSEGMYDFILLDCPPSLGLLTVNALTAAEELIVPIQCEYYALEGLGQLLRNVSLVQQNINPELRLSGIVMTMFDPRTKLSEQVVAEVQRFFGDVVYDVIIPRTVRLSEAPGYGQPITIYDPKSRGAECYRELAREVAARPPPSEPMPVFDDLPTVVVAPLGDTITPEITDDPKMPIPKVHELMHGAAGSTVAENDEVQDELETDSAGDDVTDAVVSAVAESEESESPGNAGTATLEAQVWLEELSAETVTHSSAELLSDVVAEVVQQIDDEGLWEEVEEPTEPSARVSAPRSPAPPGELPQRRVVVIDDDPSGNRREAQQAPARAEESEPSDADGIGSTMKDQDSHRRRWRRSRRGGE